MLPISVAQIQFGFCQTFNMWIEFAVSFGLALIMGFLWVQGLKTLLSSRLQVDFSAGKDLLRESKI